MNFNPHAYSVDSKERSSVYFYLAVLSILFAFGLYWSQGKFDYEVPWWLEAPSVLGFYALIFKLFEQYLWKIKLVRMLLSLKTPVLKKQYKIKLKSSYDNFASEIDADVFIKQTYMKLLVQLKTSTSNSESRGAFFCLNDSVNPSLTYEFISKPTSDAVQTMNIHHGMGTIYYGNDQLEGEYFNGRGRQQFGTFIEVTA